VRRIAGSALEDAIELRAQEAGLFRARGELVLLQAPIEPPDRRLGDCDGVALLVVGGDELMDRRLAWTQLADAELAGVSEVFGLDPGMTACPSRPSASIALHSAASLAARTGSG
jgi:hypothetical protein